jgi:hypothetical protein
MTPLIAVLGAFPDLPIPFSTYLIILTIFLNIKDAHISTPRTH